MKPKQFTGQNHTFTAPPGHEDKCDPLPALVIPARNGWPPCIMSCWEATPEELDEIKRTGLVWLGVFSERCPPVIVAGITPFTLETVELPPAPEK